MTYARTSIPDFSLANAFYALATVTVYEANASGGRTTTLAALYEAPVGPNRLTNPQTLDSEGKFVRPVYVDRDVVVVVSGRTVGTHDTGVITMPVLSDYVVDTFTGDGTTTVFTLSRVAFVASFLDVTIDGARQQPDTAYTVNGTNSLTFTQAPPFSAEIFVVHSASAPETPEVFTGPQGPQGIQGVPGIQGPAGAAGVAGSPGQGIAAAGAIGQVLTKTGTADYATGWSTPGELKVWEHGDSTKFSGGQPGLLIPFYVYPNNPYTDPVVADLLDLIRKYRRVPVIVIINPSNGPGAVEDGNYTAFIRLLQAAGAKVAGYVSTDYAARAEAAVKADVDAWLTLYASAPVDTIFYDEQTWDLGTDNANVTLYKRYTDYCHDRNLWPVICNPGTNQQGAYFETRTGDIIVIHENSSWPSESDLLGNYVGGHVDHKGALRAVLVYNQGALDQVQVRDLTKYAQWIYITHDNLPNPWDSVSDWLEITMAILADAVPVGGGTGQVLAKKSFSDFDVGWVTPAAGITDAPADGTDWVRRNNDWAAAYAGVDLPVFIPDKPSNGMLCARLVMTRNITLPPTLTGSRASAGTAATGSTTYFLQKNGVQFGTVLWSASGTIGAISGASGATLAPGDVLSVVAPDPVDPTLADISITLQGYRT